MKKILAVLLCTLATGVMAQSNKDEGFYAELGVMQANYKESGVKFNNSMGALKAGYNFNKAFAVEGMIAGNIGSANFYIGSTYITAQVQNAYGLYGKGSIDVSEGVSLYGKIGLTNGEVTASSRYASSFTSGTSASYGVGIQANINKEVYATLDYLSYYNKNGISVTGPSINLGYKF
jgi:attachment invasion locus protein